jgi:hypothetical protein
MPAADAVTCEGCPALVVWAVHERTGNRMPMNAEPTPTGTWLLQHKQVGQPPLAHWVPKGERTGDVLFTSHFATCPAAKRFRKR